MGRHLLTPSRCNMPMWRPPRAYPPSHPCCSSLPMAPGAAGSRGTPAAAGGGGAQCSSAASGCRWLPAGMRQCMQSTCAITIPCPSSWRAGDTGTQKAWGWRTLSELKSRCEVCQHLWSQRWDSEDGVLGATHSAKAMVPSLLPSCGSAGTAGDTGPGWGTSLCVAPVGTIGRPSSAGPVNAEMRGRELLPPCWGHGIAPGI